MNAEHDDAEYPAPPPVRGECLPSEIIVSYALQDMTDEVRDRAREHLTTCGRCAMTVRALLAAMEENFGASSHRIPDREEG